MRCSDLNYQNAEPSIVCGASCTTDEDCSGKCECNGHCGLSCTNPCNNVLWFEIIDYRLKKILHMFTLKISLGVLANCKRITTINCHYIL